ncbi:RNA polymerase subunit sigma-54 [Chroogloeocystis siderophila]|uniref:RNA polymerase subunit sigma-54 n=1 Tax=Chroogloeocystis siderophila 5.2 s.c.1 TaxID=247279 RepID=A0A1U7HDH9_9CHRO|nr:RNA polymerase subunit sigma-54 [Chroogloeocystis siderophila]OKH21630.1 RNA polymerase subunit sigma-54 [Chroogloeocystis siderophila 5.2 s.c.1]
MVIGSTQSLTTRLQTDTVLYPTLRQLVRLLSCDRNQVIKHLQAEAKENPFLLETPTEERDSLISDVLPQWYDVQAASSTIQEHLYGQIAALSISTQQREALIYLTQWLSSAGYLEQTPETWTKGTSWSPQELERCVPILQSLDPPGIGARSLRECLLLQLQDCTEDLAKILICDYLEELADCVGNSSTAIENCERLRQQLNSSLQLSTKITYKDLQVAIAQIQTLEPRPARNFGYSNTPIITPDLQAELTVHQTWQVSLIAQPRQRFCLNQEAIHLLQQPQAKAQNKQRLENLLQKAQSLLTALDQWQENLLKVGQFLVERQKAFLHSQDALDLIPTPQQIVAQSVGLSNATVSRIVRGRYLRVCGTRDRTIPLASLCVPVSVGGRTPQQIQQLLLQAVAEESADQPYTDEQLVQLLKLRYHLSIARRTVAKYRKAAGIAPTSMRRHREDGSSMCSD